MILKFVLTIIGHNNYLDTLTNYKSFLIVKKLFMITITIGTPFEIIRNSFKSLKKKI